MFGNLRRIGRAATGFFRSPAVALFAVLIIADVPAPADTVSWNGGVWVEQPDAMPAAWAQSRATGVKFLVRVPPGPSRA